MNNYKNYLWARIGDGDFRKQQKGRCGMAGWVKSDDINSWKDVSEKVFGVKASFKQKLNHCPLSGTSQTNVFDKSNKFTLVHYEDVNCNTEFESTKENPEAYQKMPYSELIVKMHNSFIKDSNNKEFNKTNYETFARKFQKRVDYVKNNKDLSRDQKQALHKLKLAVGLRQTKFPESQTASSSASPSAVPSKARNFDVIIFCSADGSTVQDFTKKFEMEIHPKSSFKFTDVFMDFLKTIYNGSNDIRSFSDWCCTAGAVSGGDSCPNFDSLDFMFQSVCIGGPGGPEVKNWRKAAEADVFAALNDMPVKHQRLAVALQMNSAAGKSGKSTRGSGSFLSPALGPTKVYIRLDVGEPPYIALKQPMEISDDGNRKLKDIVLNKMKDCYNTSDVTDEFKKWYISKAGAGINGAAPVFDPKVLNVSSIFHKNTDFTDSTEPELSEALLSVHTGSRVVDVVLEYKAKTAPSVPAGRSGNTTTATNNSGSQHLSNSMVKSRSVKKSIMPKTRTVDSSSTSSRAGDTTASKRAGGDSGDTSTIELNWKGPDERSGVIQVTCHPEEQKLIALNNVSIQWTNVWMNYFSKYGLKNIELKFYADRDMKNSLEENLTIAEARDHGVLADNKLYALFTVKAGSTKNPATSSSSKVSPGAKAGSVAPKKDYVNVHYKDPAGQETRCNVIYDLNGTVKQIADVLMNKYGCKFSIYTDESMKHELTPDMTIKQAKKDLKDSWPDYRILYARAIDLTGSSSPAGSPKKPDTSSRPTHRFGRKTGAGSDRPAVDKTSSSTKKYKINVSCRLKDGKIENCWASFDSNGTVEQIADVLMNKYGCKFSIYTDESMTKILEPGLPIIKSGAQRLYARAIDSTESSSPEGSTTSSGEADVCKSGSIMRLRLTNKQESGVLSYVEAKITHPMLPVKDALGFAPGSPGLFGNALLGNQNFRHAFQNWYSTVKGNGKFGVLDGDDGILSHTRLELIDTNGNTVGGYNTLRDVWHLRKSKRGEPYFNCNVIFDVSQKSR